ISTLVPLSSNSRGQVSSSPAGVTSWPLSANGAADCARNAAEYIMAPTIVTKRNELNRLGVFIIDSSPLHNGCHVAYRVSISFERALLQHHRMIRDLLAEFFGFPKGHYGVELSTLC